MKYFSTNRLVSGVSARNAILQGLAKDGGLFFPQEISPLGDEFISSIDSLDISEIALQIASKFLGEDVSRTILEEIVKETLSFPLPLIDLGSQTCVLELFHGPTLAFKDVGARFMARTMSHFWQTENRELTILAATSGDTGSAVAHGFYCVPGTRVVLLYPKNKISKTQEMQFTTLGENIHALEIKGNFDDCQAFVKQAFLDETLTKKMSLASANSINIARLIPQSFYYFHAVKELAKENLPLIFSIPCGNFGNLTAGIFAWKLGLPVEKFIASTNANSVVPEYLETGVFTPRASVSTISNAMDIGNPSNFARLQEIFSNNHLKMKEIVLGAHFNDQETRACIKEIFETRNYILDPHGAVGYLGAKAHQRPKDAQYIVLATAHPAKFSEVVEEVLGQKIPKPNSLTECLAKEQKNTHQISPSYEAVKDFLFHLH